MGDRFGLSDSDLHSLTGWLESNGLQVDWVAPSRVFIAFSGTAAAVDGAFQSELHTYRVNSERRVALNSEASIPVALAPAIRAVRGLFTLQTSPNLIARTESSANPQLTVTSGGTAYHFIAPADFATIYSIPNYLSGGGQTIGIVGRSRTDMDDYAQFNRLAYTTSFQTPRRWYPRPLVASIRARPIPHRREEPYRSATRARPLWMYCAQAAPRGAPNCCWSSRPAPRLPMASTMGRSTWSRPARFRRR